MKKREYKGCRWGVKQIKLKTVDAIIQNLVQRKMLK